MGREERGLDMVGPGLSLKQVGLGLGLVFVAVLAVVVGKEMSAEAMAVVIGVVCGVAAGIPTSVLLLVVMTRRDAARLERLEEMERRAGQRSYPPVVVVQGGGPQGLLPGSQAGYWPAPQVGPVAQRQFRVVGGDDLVLDSDDF